MTFRPIRKWLWLAGAAVVALATPARAEDVSTPCFYCDLPLKAAEADAAFRDRVTKAFPRGEKVDDVKAALKAQRFVEDFWHSRRMVFRYDNTYGRSTSCSVIARVDWTDDGAGAVETLEAHYLQTVDCAGYTLPRP